MFKRLNFFTISKKGLLAIILSFVIPFNSYSAAPGTHVFFAKLWLDKGNYSKSYEKDFIIGTLFPDIRYLKVISREKTHPKNLTLKDIASANNAVAAGSLFHAWLDDHREEFVINYGIYNKISEHPKKYKSRLLKIIEDELYWEHLDIEQTRKALSSKITKYEKSQGISNKHLRQWRDVLVFYFKTKPSVTFINPEKVNKKLLTNFPNKEIWDLSAILKNASKDLEFIDYSKKLQGHLTSLFDEYYS